MQRKKILIRSACSYLLVFIIPFALLLLWSYHQLTSEYTETLREHTEIALAQSAQTIDQQLEQLTHIAFMVQNNSSLRTDQLEQDILASRSAIQTMGLYHSVTALPEVMLTYRTGSSYLCTNTTLITPEKFITQQYIYENHSLQDFLDAFEANQSILCWPAETVRVFGGQSEKYLTLFIAVQRGSISPKQRTVYLIPVKKLLGTLQPVVADAGGIAWITDSNGTMLLSAGNVITGADLAQVSERHQSNIKINGHNYYALSTRSSVLGWTYHLLIPTASFQSSLNGKLAVFLPILLLLILTGSILSSVFSLRYYRPLRRLMDKADEVTPNGDKCNDMAQVGRSFDLLMLESARYRQRLEAYQDTLVQDMLMRILSSSPKETAGLLVQAEQLELHMQDTSWCVVAVQTEKQNESRISQLLQDALSNFSFGLEESLLCLRPMKHNGPTILIPLTAPNQVLLPERLYALQEYLCQSADCELCLGVSPVVSSLQLSSAYNSAYDALNSRMLHGANSILFYDALSPDAQGDYPSLKIEMLQHQLMLKKPDEAIELIAAIMRMLQEEHYSVNTAKILCYDLIGITMRSLYPNGMPLDVYEDLLGFDTIDELEQKLIGVIRAQCHSDPITEEASDQRLEAIRAFIQENYMKESFSLQSVADEFSVTPSNLSHYFKKYTGTGISEWVQTLRCEMACRLLVTTQSSIQEIGLRIGMPNVSSFIRFFKQQTGKTPGQYRSGLLKDAP